MNKQIYHCMAIFAISWGILGTSPAIFAQEVTSSNVQVEKKSSLTPIEEAFKLYHDHNKREAFDAFKKLILQADCQRTDLVRYTLNLALEYENPKNTCSFEDLAKQIAEIHGNKAEFLFELAKYFSKVTHRGIIYQDKFYRGHRVRIHGSQVQYVNTIAKDFVTSIQYYQKAEKLFLANPQWDADKRSSFYCSYASAWQYYVGNIDTTTIPEPQNSEPWDGYWENITLNKEDEPIFYQIPATFSQAKNNGERWRWCLNEAIQVASLENKERIIFDYAKDLYQLLKRNSCLKLSSSDDHILLVKDKKIAISEDNNPIVIFKQLTQSKSSKMSYLATKELISFYQSCCDLPKVVDCLRSIEKNPSFSKHDHKILNDLVKNWVFFINHSLYNMVDGSINMQFRNTTEVTFKIRKFNPQKYLAFLNRFYTNHKTIKEEFNKLKNDNKSHSLSLHQTQYDFISALLKQGHEEFFDTEVITKTEKLSPLKDYQMTNASIPLNLNSGWWWIEMTAKEGNTDNVLLPINHLKVILFPFNRSVKKQEQSLYYIFNNKTGEPVADVKAKFGFINKNRTQIIEKKSDAKGMICLFDKEGLYDFSHQTEALHFIFLEDKEGKTSLLPFQSMRNSWTRDDSYNQLLFLLDRPVYRPGQTVKFSGYFFGKNTKSVFSYAVTQIYQKDFSLKIINPEGKTLHLFPNLTIDQYGRFHAEWKIPQEAKLGHYSIYFSQKNSHLFFNNSPQGVFMVEEYKKPEFFVSVEAPKTPQVFGEKIKIKVKADYYFGAPVKEGKIKVEVNRQSVDSQWFPINRWDWLYGNGYGLAPLKRNWNSDKSLPIPHYSREEQVLSKEYQIDEKGFVEIEIDTSKSMEIFGYVAQKYIIDAEIMDSSRRTITGTGSILVAKIPFKIYSWLNRGFYHIGETIEVSTQIRQIDGAAWQIEKGKIENVRLSLYRLIYDKEGKPTETLVLSQTAEINPQTQMAQHKFTASEVGQYRLEASYEVDGKKSESEVFFDVRGNLKLQENFRYSKLELLVDKREYQPGDEVKVVINSDVKDAKVLLFIRPNNKEIEQLPNLIQLQNGTFETSVKVLEKDYPNFYLYAMMIDNGEFYEENRNVYVPPKSKVLDLTIQPSATRYQPGEKVKTKIKITDSEGQPIVGSVVMSIYDKSLDSFGYPSSFSTNWKESLYAFLNFCNINVTEIKPFYAYHGIFSGVLDYSRSTNSRKVKKSVLRECSNDSPETMANDAISSVNAPSANNSSANVMIRSKFVDTLYWSATLETNANGELEVEFPMKDNLTTWKIVAKAITKDAKIGEGEAEIISSKDFLVRLQTPRFLTEGDQATFSVNIHNYLNNDEPTQAILEIDGSAIELMTPHQQTTILPANGEKRLDWQVKALKEGEVTVRIKAIGKNAADAMEINLPITIWGMDKLESFNRIIAANENNAKIDFVVPHDRKAERTRLNVQCSPSLAGAMLDALPFLILYPHGCTEQTLNRFLPTAIVRQILAKNQALLPQIQQRINSQNSLLFNHTNKEYQPKTGIFDAKFLDQCVIDGVNRLTKMQCSDGGWGWFSGLKEHSYIHTTAWVVRGLILAEKQGIAIDKNSLNRGIAWLKNVQEQEVKKLINHQELKDGRIAQLPKGENSKVYADHLDVLIYSVLAEKLINNSKIIDFLYRDRNQLSAYGKCLLAIGLFKENHQDKVAMLKRNLEQDLVFDNENQTAYLDLQNNAYWWFWYNDDIETQAMYLKLLLLLEPTSNKTASLVKYLFNNRKNGTFWKSTRDTSLCLEVCAEYLQKNIENDPNMNVSILLDGKEIKTFHLDSTNFLSAENELIIKGKDLKSGKHQLEIRRQGQGRLYIDAKINNYTMEKNITPAGLELKIARRYYKLVKTTQEVKTTDKNNQPITLKTGVINRVLLKSGDQLQPGDQIEVELDIDAKNDYEYLLVEDPKPAGCEPIITRNGYCWYQALFAYSEFRDQKTNHYLNHIPRGKYLITYRLRAETPGTFQVMPTVISSMYATDLKGNSQSGQLKIAP